MFEFAIIKKDDEGVFDDALSKRKNQEVEKIAICKIAKQDLSTEINIKWILLDTSKLPSNGNQIIEWKD